MRFCMDMCLAVVLIQIAWTDIRTMMIPDRVLVPLMILAGLSVFTEPEIPFTARLIGIFCTALPMYLANLFVDGALVAVISGCWQPQDSVSDGKHA